LGQEPVADRPDLDPSDVFVGIDAFPIVRRIRKDCRVRMLAATHAGRGGTFAVADAGGGRTLLHAGVARGVCSTPSILSAVPVVTLVGGNVAARTVSRRLA
jgi:hypothetical protein